MPNLATTKRSVEFACRSAADRRKAYLISATGRLGQLHQGIDFTSILDGRRAFLEAETVFSSVGSGLTDRPVATPVWRASVARISECDATCQRAEF
jgi:hypothetical protein